MEANFEASDLTATELPPTYLRAFHSLIALDFEDGRMGRLYEYAVDSQH